MPHPYPGQEWKHGWKPLSPAAAISKNHGRKPAPGSKAASVSAQADRAIRGMANRRRSGTAATSTKAGPAPTKAAPSPKGAPGAAPPARDKKFLDQQYGQWRESLTPAQEKAMRFYQSPGFALMNGQLRGLRKDQIKADVSFNDSDLARARQASKDLTAAIRKAPPLKEPMTVYRGFSADQFGDLKPGDSFTDKGFVSTSLTNDVGSVGRATRQATAEIRLPVGTKAAAGSSREMVLPPGSKFRVLAVSSKRGVPHYVMELA